MSTRPTSRGGLALLASLAVFAAGFVLGTVNPSYDLLDEVSKQLSSLNQFTGVAEAAAILVNNVYVTAQLIVYSLAVAPGLFLLGLQGYILGMFAVLFHSRGMLSLFLAGIAPHGVFELPAILYATATGLDALYMLLKRRPIDALMRIMRGFYIVLFLLLVAAFVETYVTPLALKAVGVEAG